MEKKEVCVRCGADKSIVRTEGSHGCYVYGDKVAERHSYSIEQLYTQEELDSRVKKVVGEILKNQGPGESRYGDYDHLLSKLIDLKSKLNKQKDEE